MDDRHYTGDDTRELGPKHDICEHCGSCRCPDCKDCACDEQPVTAAALAVAVSAVLRRNK
jgi:hypothetical protein